MDPRLSGDRTRSCGSCHPAGRSNGRVYAEGEEVEPGGHGARNVPSLQGVWQSAPYLWDGSLPTLREAVRRMLRVEMRDGQLHGREFDALLAYVKSLAPFDRGRVQPDGVPVEPVTLAARRGAEVFLEAKCDLCHPAPAYLRPMNADVDTGGTWNVPTLLGLSTRSPYGHDGRWISMVEAVDAMLEARKIELSDDQREQLLAYLDLL